MTLPSSRALARASLRAGLLAGALDIAAAVMLNLGVGPKGVLQSVASGVLGRAAYTGGWSTAGLGLALHFAIMLVIAAGFVGVSTRWPGTRRRWIAAGIVWGLVVWAVMTHVVVPLSAAPLPPPDVAGTLQGLLVHVLMVGLPIAWATRRSLGRDWSDPRAG